MPMRLRIGSCAAAAAVLLTSSSALPYGESTADGLPSADERRVHLLTNEVRAAPHDFPNWETRLASPEARPPLGFHDALFAAARFHAVDMATAGCFQHASCDGTSTAQRISRFFSGGGFAENIALGQRDALGAVVAWMNSETGHREQILNPMWNVLGTGASAGPHWVQNFGRVDGPLPRIVSAADFPQESQLRLAALAYSPAAQVPSRFEAILGGEVHALAPGVGRPGQRIWEIEVPRPSGCVPLVFELEDGSGEITRFPTTGSLQAGPGCSSVFSAEAAPDTTERPILDADLPEQGCRAATGSSNGFLCLLLFVLCPQVWRRTRFR